MGDDDQVDGQSPGRLALETEARAQAWRIHKRHTTLSNPTLKANASPPAKHDDNQPVHAVRFPQVRSQKCGSISARMWKECSNFALYLSQDFLIAHNDRHTFQ